MEKNLGTPECLIRIMIGSFLLYMGPAMKSGLLMFVVVFTGIILTAVGLIGRCPLYSILKISTAPRDP